MDDKKTKLFKILAIALLVALVVAVFVTSIVLNDKRDHVDNLPDIVIENIKKN